MEGKIFIILFFLGGLLFVIGGFTTLGGIVSYSQIYSSEEVQVCYELGYKHGKILDISEDKYLQCIETGGVFKADRSIFISKTEYNELIMKVEQISEEKEGVGPDVDFGFLLMIVGIVLLGIGGTNMDEMFK